MPLSLCSTLFIICLHILDDILTFLVFFAVSILGFSFALASLYKTDRAPLEQCARFDAPESSWWGASPPSTNLESQDTDSDACRAVGSWRLAFAFLFWGLFGMSDHDQLVGEGVAFTYPDFFTIAAQIIFAVYMLATGIMILNLLIAILSDT